MNPSDSTRSELSDTELLAQTVIPDARLEEIGFVNHWSGHPIKGRIEKAWFLLDNIYVQRAQGEGKYVLEKIDGETGLQSWAFSLEGRLEIAPQIYRYPKELRGSNSDELFVVQHKVGIGDHIFCLDDKFGATNYTIPCNFTISSPVTASQEYVFVGSYNNRIYCFSKATHRQEWTYITEGPIAGAPEVGDVNVFFGSEDGFIYALNQAKGWLQGKSWRVRTDAMVVAKPIFYHNRLYVGSWDFKVYRLEIYQGIRNWSHPAGARVSQAVFPFKDWIFAVNDGDIASTKPEPTLVAIDDSMDSRISWERTAVERVLAADGFHCYALAHGPGRKIHALRLEDGEIAWTLDAGNFDFVLGQDAERGAAREKWGQIYLVDRSGIMQCIRPGR